MERNMTSKLSSSSIGVAISFLFLSGCGGTSHDHEQSAPVSDNAPASTPTSSEPSPSLESSPAAGGGKSVPKARRRTPEARTEPDFAPSRQEEQPRTIQIVITPLRTKGIPYGAEAREESSGILLAKAEQVAMQDQILEVDEVQYSSAGAIIYRGRLFFDAGGRLIRQERIEGNQKWRIFTSWNLGPY